MKPKKGAKKSASANRGTMRSPKQSASSSAWTEKEMDAAKPLPLPTVPDVAGQPTTPPTPSTSHAGTGRTSSAGMPEAS